MNLYQAFIKIYGEELKRSHFVKINKKRPYFIRRVNEEIIHIITYAPAMSNVIGHNAPKAFCVLGGVATTYRKHLNFDLAPYKNNALLFSAGRFYCRCERFGFSATEYEKVNKFYYNEEHILDDVYDSVVLVKKFMLPELDRADSLEDAVNFFRDYRIQDVAICIDRFLDDSPLFIEEIAAVLSFEKKIVESYFTKRVNEIRQGAKDTIGIDALERVRDNTILNCEKILNDKTIQVRMINKSKTLKYHNLALINKIIS